MISMKWSRVKKFMVFVISFSNLKCECFTGHFDDHYKLRGGVYFVDELPFTSTGQIDRQLVREIVVELFSERSS